MFSLHGHIRELAGVFAAKLPEGRGISDEAIKKKYEDTLKATPEAEQDKTIKTLLSEIDEIIKDKEVPDEVAGDFPKWDLEDFKEYAKYLKGEKKVEEEKKPEKKEPEKKEDKGVSVERVNLFFIAPDPPSTETITPQGNFRWIGEEIIFREGLKHYSYRTPLWVWGEEKEEGSPVILEYDTETKKTEETEDFTPDQIKNKLKRYRALPPYTGKRIYEPLSELHGFFYNVRRDVGEGRFDIDIWATASKKHTYADFDKNFRKSGFYKMVGKDTKKLENP